MIFCAFFDHRGDQILRDTTQTESADKERVSTLDVVDCLLCTTEYLRGEAARDEGRKLLLSDSILTKLCLHVEINNCVV